MRKITSTNYVIETKGLSDWLNELNKTTIPLGEPQDITSLLANLDKYNGAQYEAAFPNETALKEFAETYDGMYGDKYIQVCVCLDRLVEYPQDWKDQVTDLTLAPAVSGIKLSLTSFETIDVRACDSLWIVDLKNNPGLTEITGLEDQTDIVRSRIMDTPVRYNPVALALHNSDGAIIADIMSMVSSPAAMVFLGLGRLPKNLIVHTGNTNDRFAEIRGCDLASIAENVKQRLADCITLNMTQTQALMSILGYVGYSISSYPCEKLAEMDAKKFSPSSLDRDEAWVDTLPIQTIWFVMRGDNASAVCYSKCQLAKWMCEKAGIRADIVLCTMVNNDEYEEDKVYDGNHSILRVTLDNGTVLYSDLANPGISCANICLSYDGIQKCFVPDGYRIILPGTEKKFADASKTVPAVVKKNEMARASLAYMAFSCDKEETA